MSVFTENSPHQCRNFLHGKAPLSRPPNILIVEDEPDLRALIDQVLTELPADVSQADNGSDALDMACENFYDLLILDIQLPRLSGFDVCQQLRSKQIYTPILFLTAKRSELDQVHGLEIGGDDYITKPFSILPLQARVKALLRREQFVRKNESKPGESDQVEAILCFHDLVISAATLQAHYAGKDLKLTPKEWKLLWTLARAPGRIFSREQLLLAVWGEQYNGFEHTVNSHMNRLRAKLSESGSNNPFIRTVWGSGYQFESSNDQAASTITST
jgi:two-component system, OmpR family, alkaline phosphatase synthesis response regulator PhoP